MEERIKEKFFPHHRKATARLNHGSFGALPVPVKEYKTSIVSDWLTQPDDFYYNVLQPQQQRSKKIVARLLNTEPERISFVDNATTGGAIVSQKIMWDLLKLKEQSQSKTYVLQFDICYLAMRKVVEAYIIRAGCELLEAKIPFPYESQEEILESIENSLKSVPIGSIKVAFLDHITSAPSILLPLKEIVQLCRQYEVEEIFVDGAHAVGLIPLDMKELDVDYYTSNLHKWMYTPTGCAFLYSSKSKDDPNEISTIHHVVPSFYYNQGLSEETKWSGTNDYSPRLSVPESIRFYTLMGHILSEKDENLLNLSYDELLDHFQLQGDEFEIHYGVSNYLREKALEKSKWLATLWKTRVIDLFGATIGLIMIEFPNQLPFSGIKDTQTAEKLRHQIRNEFELEIFIVANSNGCFLRLSCQIYNIDDDFERLNNAVESLMLNK